MTKRSTAITANDILTLSGEEILNKKRRMGKDVVDGFKQIKTSDGKTYGVFIRGSSNNYSWDFTTEQANNFKTKSLNRKKDL
jgi:hypothetical protein